MEEKNGWSKAKVYLLAWRDGEQDKLSKDYGEKFLKFLETRKGLGAGEDRKDAISDLYLAIQEHFIKQESLKSLSEDELWDKFKSWNYGKRKKIPEKKADQSRSTFTDTSIGSVEGRPDDGIKDTVREAIKEAEPHFTDDGEAGESEPAQSLEKDVEIQGVYTSREDGIVESNEKVVELLEIFFDRYQKERLNVALRWLEQQEEDSLSWDVLLLFQKCADGKLEPEEAFEALMLIGPRLSFPSRQKMERAQMADLLNETLNKQKRVVGLALRKKEESGLVYVDDQPGQRSKEGYPEGVYYPTQKELAEAFGIDKMKASSLLKKIEKTTLLDIEEVLSKKDISAKKKESPLVIRLRRFVENLKI